MGGRGKKVCVGSYADIFYIHTVPTEFRIFNKVEKWDCELRLGELAAPNRENRKDLPWD